MEKVGELKEAKRVLVPVSSELAGDVAKDSYAAGEATATHTYEYQDV